MTFCKICCIMAFNSMAFHYDMRHKPSSRKYMMRNMHSKFFTKPLLCLLYKVNYYVTIVCVFSFGQSRPLFGVDPSLVSIEIGEASLISSLKNEQIRGLPELLP